MIQQNQFGIINAFPHHHEKINFKINNLDKSLTNNFSFKEIQIILPINQKINFTLHQKIDENNDTYTWPTNIKLINENKNKLENENLKLVNINLNNSFDQSGCGLEVKINGEQIKALVDTGSLLTIINCKLIFFGF